MAAKPESYFLTSATRRTAVGSAFGYPTVEAALRAADAILAKDAELIWIEDRKGNLILPADQVRLRASSAPGAR
jgi:hypothetical protein